jgi:hypothetical protein
MEQPVVTRRIGLMGLGTMVIAAVGGWCCLAPRAMAAQVDVDNADWVLTAAGALEGREPAAVEICLARREGRWQGAFALAPKWNEACHPVDANELTWADGRLKGKVTISFRGDGYVPAGRAPTACWELNAVRDGNAMGGTFAGKLGAKAVEGKLTGELAPPPRDLNSRRIRVRLVDSAKLGDIFWCAIEDSKPAGGYLFRGAWDGQVDLSRVALRGCAMSGNVRPMSSGDGNAGAAWEIHAFVIAGRVGGTFSRPGGAEGGVLAGTCVPLSESRVAPYRPPAGAATAPAGDAASKDLPERWRGAFLLPAGVPDPPPCLTNVMMPPGYDKAKDAGKRYPVVLHNGVGGASGALWQAMEKHTVRPMIHCNIALRGDGFDGSLDRVLAYLDRYWPTIADGRARVAMGFSAGAHHIFRYIDRTDLVGNYAFFGHPLQASGWATQKAAEREAMIRGATTWAKRPVNILIVAGTGEGGFKGVEPTRRVLETYGVKAKCIVIDGLRHDHAGHFERKGDEIWAWVESCLPPPASAAP